MKRRSGTNGADRKRSETAWRREARRSGVVRLKRRRTNAPSFAVLVVAGVLIGAGMGWFGPDLMQRLQSRREAVMPVSGDSLSAQFGFCHTGGGTNCVVDGDTFWFRGERVRVMDIDAPETHPPRCPEEAALGARATQRLQEMLNAGPFSLESGDRDTDRYGRALRVVTRGGQSLGEALVAEGLAREWDGARRPWC
ncbi:MULTISPECIES: thermonuclease family protein [Sphingobium]|uniref:Nuclease n=1 Tax=Sphingobium chungbukense TaxID=56193 RepID=A0A0M3AR77_9SPHN|nr:MULTISPECIES: thermonuclease family protein [Sphingobium]KKW92413.1 nuclease [Sphingobium chungbukense]PJG48721.1 nuclease [Sphingobium sp. LB126]